MSREDQLDRLLCEWDDRSRQGHDVTAEELTRDCPELTAPLEKRIIALQAMHWLDSEDDITTDENHESANLDSGERNIPLPDTNLSSKELLKHLSD